MVRKEGQVFKFAQVVQTFDLGDQIEAEVEPAEVDQRVKSLDLRNDIVVQLQFGQVLHPHQVVNFHDVYIQIWILSVTLSMGRKKGGIKRDLLLYERERWVSSQMGFSSSSKMEFSLLY